MNLAEAKRLDIPEHGTSALHAAIAAWQHQPASELSDHRAPCCAVAREWLLAMDRSHTPADEPLTGPRWIRQRVSWGASHWPLHWCDAVVAKKLDCGALAALAKSVFRARGVRCHSAQLIELFTTDDGGQWSSSWQRDGASPSWVRDELVYHEACAIELPHGEIRIWDPTASWWTNPKHVAGYGAALAVRVLTSDPDGREVFTWGTHTFRPNEWHRLQVHAVQPLSLVAAA